MFSQRKEQVAKISIPEDLSRYANGETKFAVDGSNIGEVLDGLFLLHPDLQKRIVSDDGQLFSYLPVFFNGEKLATVGYRLRNVVPSDHLEVVLIASGG